MLAPGIDCVLACFGAYMVNSSDYIRESRDSNLFGMSIKERRLLVI